jgi:diguanylate cyclase (GGDEF)-like protein
MTGRLHLVTGQKRTERLMSGSRGSWIENQVLDRSGFVQTLRIFAEVASRGRLLMLLLVDINRFQWVNDAFGWEVGDRVLEVTGTAIKRAAGPEGVVGRLDGSRFGVLAFLPSKSAAIGLAREILALISDPLPVAGGTVHVTGRIGITECNQIDSNVVTRMLRYAGAALSAAKAAPTGEPIVCTDVDRARADLQARICRELPQAIHEGRLRVAYQPIVHLRSLRTASHEALIRWRTVDGVDVPPSQFVPIAEELGLIDRIGNWVLNEASHVGSSLSALGAPALHVAVNLSPQQFANPTLPDVVERTLQRHHLAARNLVFEITERTAVDNNKAASTLGELRAIGCPVGLDDFGTGQSCLSYLRSLPLDFIKVDRSFIAELESDHRARQLVGTIATMASDLGLTTVAEGIESKGQHDAAVDAGCTFGQGYLFGRPTFHPELGRVV